MNTTGQKFGGRKKGTPNKLTTETKELLQNVINDEIQNLPDRLKELDAKERLNIITKLLPYVLPKQSEIIDNDPRSLEPVVFRLIDAS
jgi:hypothetical protein